MTRSALVGLIHDKTMRSPGIAYDDGESTTLMSTDADSLDDFAEIIHETWAQVIEVVIGIYLLAIEVGWIWPLPLVLIFREFVFQDLPQKLTSNLRSMLPCQSLCCNASRTPSKSLEQSHTKSCGGYKLYAELNENHQNAWVSTKHHQSYRGASERGVI